MEPNRRFRIVRVSCTIGLLASLIGLSAASTIRTDRLDSQYLALASTYDYVGKVFGGGAGSGTLIAPNWVLTAGHVFWGGTSGSVEFAGTSYGISEVHEYPSWELGKNDLALVKLATPVVGITPAKLWAGGGEVGKLATSVGYGTSGDGVTGNTGGYGTRRAFQNVIDGYDLNIWGFNYRGLLIDFDKPDGSTNTFGLIGSSATPVDLEGCATPGDSGGGLFTTFGGQEYLVGVTSYVAWEGVDPWAGRPNNTYGYYGDNNGYSRVGDSAAWIQSKTGIVATVPEPSSLCGLLLLVGLARRTKSALRKK